MASPEKLMGQIVKLEGKLRDKTRAAGEITKSVGKIPALAQPLLSGGTAAAAAYADGRMGTAANKHPVSIAATAVTGVGALVTAAMGHPTASQALSAAASGPLSFLLGSAAFDKGSAAKLAGAAAPPAR
jgi:hypothetical protein